MPAFLMTGKGHPKHAKRVRAICKRHGADLTLANLPGDGKKWWVEAPNMGAPFDDQRRDAILADLRAADMAQYIGRV